MLKSEKKEYFDTIEIPISFESAGLILRGIFHRPINKITHFSMVFCHGYFQSNRIGPLALYVDIARTLAQLGISCLRFDCAGFGESDGRYTDITFDSLSENLRSAITWVRNFGNIERGNIGIIGHSIGGNIAINVAHTDTSIKALCLLSPIATKEHEKDRMFSDAQLSELHKNGFTIRKGIPATVKVYRPIHGGIAFKQAREIKAETIIMVGDHDPYCSTNQYLYFSRAFAPQAKLRCISNADHNFLPLESRICLFKNINNWILNLQ